MSFELSPDELIAFTGLRRSSAQARFLDARDIPYTRSRRGSFRSVKELTNKITQFVQRYNKNCQPFIWTASADSILDKLARLCGRIIGTGH